MIIFTVTSPVETISPGVTSVSLQVESDNPSEDFEDSIVLLGNGTLIELIKIFDEDLEAWVCTGSLDLIGGTVLTLELTAIDEDGEDREVWSVVVEAVNFTRSLDYTYSPYLDVFSSYLPPGTKAGGYKESVFGQFMNPIAVEFDRIRQSLQAHNRSLSYQDTSAIDPDWLYEYELSESDDVKLALRPDGSVGILSPSCWAYIGVNRIPLSAAERFYDFWTAALPSRFTSSVVSSEGTTSRTPFLPLSEIQAINSFTVPTQEKIFLELYNGASLVDINQSELGETIIAVEGQRPDGSTQSESIILHKNGATSSKWKWKSVAKATLVSNIENVGGDLSFSLFPPRLAKKKESSFRAIQDRVPETIFWSVNLDELGTSIDRLVSAETELFDIARGEDTAQVVSRSRLLDMDSEEVFLTDFGIGQSDNYLYGVDAEKLYIWDKLEAVPTNLPLLSEATEDPELNFALAAYSPPELLEGVYSTVVSVELERARNTKLCRAWMWSVINPDGSQLYINPFTGETSESELWNDNGLPIQDFGVPQRDFEVTLDVLGDYIFELRLSHVDGTESVSRKIFQFRSKVAIATYDLSTLLELTDSVNRIYVTESNELLLSNAEIIYLLKPAYDSFLLDPENNKIYFREDYDSVEVTF